MKKILLLLLVSTGLLLTSCYKEPENGIAKIVVVDKNDFRVPSASVHMDQHGQLTTGYINVNGIADMNGEFTYEHDPALQVILNVQATSPDGLHHGIGIINIKPDETATTKIKLD